jgi:uncharacterized protein
MRTSNAVVSIGLLGLALGLSPAASFDGTRTPEGATVAVPLTGPDSNPAPRPDIGRATPLAAVPVVPLSQRPVTPFEAFRSGTKALRAGNTEQAVNELEYAAEQGMPAAQWKLGRMYADGDGVPKNMVRAFEYFSRLTKAHGDDVPGTAQARFVANAFVALGHYYLKGIPNTAIVPDAGRAREMFSYAASYFGDADAQYQLGRLYLDGSPSDPRQAARWFQLSATKGDCRAEAVLGDMLFQGKHVPRQAARGLMLLTLGRDCAGTEDGWIKPLYDNAFHRASDDERAMALVYLEGWLKGRRE